MYTIRFKFEQKGLEPITLKNIEPGYSLLEIALNNDIKLNHQCGGICSCATCHVYIEKGMDSICKMNNREKDFIVKAIKPAPNSRLGCQSLLLEGSGVIEVTLPDQVSGKMREPACRQVR